MRKFVLLLALLAVTLTTLITPIPPANAKTQQGIMIDGDHGKLAVIIQTPDMSASSEGQKGLEGQKGKYPMVIICHGFTSQKEFLLLKELADDLEAAGIASVRFDFNGHGKSEGRLQDMTVRNEIEDAKKVFDYVRKLPEVTTISIAGHSQGGVVSSMLAGKLADKIKSVVLFAPAAVLRENAITGSMFGVQYNPLNPPEYVEVLGGYKVGRNYMLTARDLPIYEVASQYRGPACMIHGTGDTIVPYTYSLRYAEIWKDSELHIIPEWDHGFNGHEAEAAKIAAEFFSKIVK